MATQLFIYKIIESGHTVEDAFQKAKDKFVNLVIKRKILNVTQFSHHIINDNSSLFPFKCTILAITNEEVNDNKAR